MLQESLSDRPIRGGVVVGRRCGRVLLSHGQFADDSGLGEGDDDNRNGQNHGRDQQHEPYSRAPNVIAAHAPSAHHRICYITPMHFLIYRIFIQCNYKEA